MNCRICLKDTEIQYHGEGNVLTRISLYKNQTGKKNQNAINTYFRLNMREGRLGYIAGRTE